MRIPISSDRQGDSNVPVLQAPPSVCEKKTTRHTLFKTTAQSILRACR
jgi:hypothetical protein